MGIVLEKAEHPIISPRKHFNVCWNGARVFYALREKTFKNICKKCGFEINSISFLRFLLILMLETVLTVALSISYS